MRHFLLFTILVFMVVGSSQAQTKLKNPAVYVDSKGVMRWSNTKQEATFYGINYSVPFAHAYRAMKKLEYDFKSTIDKDVYHFARLGFNAYRIHVWDKEISDKAGNLIANEHLDYFDYLLAKLKERNIFIILTVMRMGDSGYPEPDEWYGGFTDYWKKSEAHVNPEAIAAHVNFTQQFIKHVNPYTGVSYMDDSDIIAFEVDNEPSHPGTAEQMRHYINTLLKAYMDVGNKKPVFYNVTHNLQYVDSYYQTDIDGTTFQWYPTGLVAGFERKGNFLPHADEYNIPFRNVKNFDKKAKMVYEFDAPDFGGAYLYPAIARSFRSAGMQWITMFAYDAMDLAWANSEYVTHYLNLAYTPDKAIGMKIAAEVTHTVPLNKQYKAYPNDTVFESFRVSYKENLSEMNTSEKFFHANTTSTTPINISTLNEVAGHGNSPIVKYEGTGAYFINRLEDGIWRLEVMPDVLWIEDPFEKPTLRREVATIMWNTWPIEIDLPSLGTGYNIVGLNSKNNFRGTASDKLFNVSPGVYLLSKSNILPQNIWNSNSKWGVIRLGEYAAPEHRANKFVVVHSAPKSVVENTPVTIHFDIAGPSLPDSAAIYTGWRHHRFPNTPRILLQREKGMRYVGTIPVDQVVNGTLFYTVVVYKNGQSQTFPAKADANPLDWDYYWHEYWKTPIVPQNSPIRLVTIDERNKDIEVRGIPDRSSTRAVKSLVAVSELETTRMKVVINPLLNLTAATPARFFVRKVIKPEIDAHRNKIEHMSRICLQIKNPQNINQLYVGFVTNTGFTYSALCSLGADKSVYKIPILQVKQTTTALLPETYPVFLKRYFVPDSEIPFRIQDIEILEISTDELTLPSASFELGAVWLE